MDPRGATCHGRSCRRELSRQEASRHRRHCNGLAAANAASHRVDFGGAQGQLRARQRHPLLLRLGAHAVAHKGQGQEASVRGMARREASGRGEAVLLGACSPSAIECCRPRRHWPSPQPPPSPPSPYEHLWLHVHPHQLLQRHAEAEQPPLLPATTGRAGEHRREGRSVGGDGGGGAGWRQAQVW